MTIKYKRKIFQLPKPIMIRGDKSRSLIRSHDRVSMGKRDIKSKPRLTRPKFTRHVCVPNCLICIKFINQNSKWKKRTK